MQPLTKLLMAAALVLAVVGLALALARPGDLGDDGAETAQPDVTEPGDGDATTTTTVTDEGDAEASTSTTTEAVGGAEGTTSTTTTVAGDRVDPPPGSASGGSGLDGGSSGPRDLEDGLAATGGTSLLGGAVALALLGLALPRRRD